MNTHDDNHYLMRVSHIVELFQRTDAIVKEQQLDEKQLQKNFKYGPNGEVFTGGD